MLAITILLFSFCFPSQAAQKPPADIVQKLLPNPNNPSSVVLPKPAERADDIKLLKEAQRDASGFRAQQLSFVLAALNVDYERNRDYLIWVLRGCDVPEIKNGCDENTGQYLVYLLHGHRDVLAPLLDAATKDYNAVASEGLGSFFAGFAANSPDDFLAAVRSFPVAGQKRACSFAGSGDGGGMALEDLKKVRAHWGTMNDEVAQRCLRAIEGAHKVQ